MKICSVGAIFKLNKLQYVLRKEIKRQIGDASVEIGT